MNVSRKSFFETYLNAIDSGDAALFIGAGMSVASGMVNWKDLLRDIAQDIGLDVDKETDLISLAQYHINRKRNRAALNQKLIVEFTKDAKPTENHRLIASLPIRSIWTTNYDTLVEDAIKDAHKRPDVKSTKENLSQSNPHRDTTVYKMHGDISQPQDAVLTKEDYDLYDRPDKRRLYIEKLEGDLVSKTFLFLGFSFTDPNISYVLARLNAFLGQNIREHFCLMRRPQPPVKPKGNAKRAAYDAALAEYQYEQGRFDLRVEDWKRYGISTLEIDEYSEITDILTELNKRGHRREVFVSGSASDFAPFNQPRLDSFAGRLGSEIISRDFNLVSGFGLGIGSTVLMGAMEGLYRASTNRQEGRTLLRPFPQSKPASMSLAQFNSKYRRDMLSESGSVIFVSGNKIDSKGRTIVADGVLEEFEIAKELGKTVVPVGATGHAAHSIWKEVNTNLAKFFKAPNKVKPHFKTLGDTNSSDDDLIKAIFAIIGIANEV